MCDFCFEHYDPECIGITESQIRSMPDFKCPACKNSGTNSSLTKEGESQ